VRLRNHPEYRVRAPSGYTLSDLKKERAGTEQQDPQKRLLAAMSAPLPVTDLGVSVQADYLETDADDKQVSLTVFFEGDSFRYEKQDQRRVVNLEILSVVEDSYGKQVEGISAMVQGNLTEAGMEQARTGGYRFSRRLPLAPGVYHARIGVREEGSNRIGTASTWVEVPEVAEKRLEMSSLILSDPLHADLSIEGESVRVSDLQQVRMVQGVPIYETGDIFYYTYRVHPGASVSGKPDLLVMWEVSQGGSPVAAGEWNSIRAELQDTDAKGWFDLDGELNINNFDTGVYELQVRVRKSDSEEVVQRTVTFGVQQGRL
jgi:hypothetical protein